jgi:AcrR family transcriptional regulator
MYNHFASKEALIAEIARLDSDNLAQVIAAGDGLQPISAIRAICASYLSQAMRQWQVILELEITALAPRSPEVAQAFSGSQTQLRAALIALIEKGQSTGEIAPGPAPEIANMILDLLSAHAQRLGLQDRHPNTNEQAILARSLSGILGTQIID